MLTQPAIEQMFSGFGWMPLQPENWHLATQTGNANQITQAMIALGIKDAKAVNMAGWVDSDGNFHNEMDGSFRYMDPITRFYELRGTVILNPGPNQVVLPITDVAGRLWDRQSQPSSQDRPAPVHDMHTATLEQLWPNGAHLKVLTYADEGYAMLFWDANA